MLLVLLISKLGSLVVYLRNKLAGTRKLPELPSRNPPPHHHPLSSPLEHWSTGLERGKKQTKHSSTWFTHVQVWARAHPRAQPQKLGLKLLSWYKEQIKGIFHFKLSQTESHKHTATRALVSLIGTEVGIQSIYRQSSNVEEKVLGFRIINTSVRKMTS